MVNKLEEICAVKIMAELCCKPQVKEKFLMVKLLAGISDIEFREDVLKLKGILEQLLLDEIKNLSYPIRRNMPKHLLHLIAIEMIDFMIYQHEWFGLAPSYCLTIFKSSHFTHEGTLDKVLIARDIVQDESLNVLHRIVIALSYCQIDNIRVLWGKMTENEKQFTCQEKFLNKFNFSNSNYWKVYPWRRILHLAVMNNNSDKYLFVDVCRNALLGDEEVAFKNSWMRLSSLEKEYVSKIISTTCGTTWTWKFFCLNSNAIVLNRARMKIVRYWIYNVNEELLKKSLLPNYIHLSVLKLFLLWPYREMFVKTLNLVWETIPDFDFYELLHSIVDLIEDDEISSTYNYRLILKEVWDIAPSNYKKYVSSMESENFRPSYSTSQYSTFIKDDKLKFKFVYYYHDKGNSLLEFLILRLFCFKTVTNADVIFIEHIASDFTKKAKRKIVRTQGDDICENALISERLMLANLFMKCFVEKELISEYKQGFFARRGKHLSDVLLSKGKKSLLDDITNWASNL